MTRRLGWQSRHPFALPTCATTAAPACIACQYAPPHEFAVNVPQAMAQVRPNLCRLRLAARVGQLYQRNGFDPWRWRWWPGSRCSCCWPLGLHGQGVNALWQSPCGGFTASSHCSPAGGHCLPVFLFADAGPGPGRAPLLAHDVTPAASGCAAETPATAGPRTPCCASSTWTAATATAAPAGTTTYALSRRRLHFTFYGFTVLAAATSVATLYHYLLDVARPVRPASLPGCWAALAA